MTFTLTLEGIFLIVLGLLGLAIGIYLLVVLKNANRLIQNANKALEDNKTNIDHVLDHLEELSGNTAHFSGEVKKQFEKNEVLVSSMLKTGADSMLLVNDATSRIRTLVANFNDIVTLANNLIKKFK
ncbi:MAG TPA: hypothetical protein VJ969_01550 [Desulfopila sp.]|nr:hypothetical protein [Desulfopila sp.]